MLSDASLAMQVFDWFGGEMEGSDMCVPKRNAELSFVFPGFLFFEQSSHIILFSFLCETEKK